MCGRADRADEALRVTILMKQEGIRPDRSCFNAFLNGRRAASGAEEDAGGGRRKRQTLMQRAFKRLFRVECVPESLGMAVGGIERIRVKF